MSQINLNQEPRDCQKKVNFNWLVLGNFMRKVCLIFPLKPFRIFDGKDEGRHSRVRECFW